MSSSFVFGENNSSFDYDNKFDRLMSLLESINNELRTLNREVSEFRAEFKSQRHEDKYRSPYDR